MEYIIQETKNKNEHDVLVDGVKMYKIFKCEKMLHNGYKREKTGEYYYEISERGERRKCFSNVYMGGRTLKNIAEAMREIKRLAEKNKNVDAFKNIDNKCKYLVGEENSNFYPTPKRMAGMMFSGIDFKNVKTVLEPSAGKGDLIDCLKAYDGDDRRHFDVDCIEKEKNLQFILKGKNHKLIYDDFLLFNSCKRYDLILMNPPFSEGARHLLKAIELQKEGGQICCLLNAETIKNPYTNERKILQTLLEKHNAKIKFIKNGFSKAERKTDVETAVIWINIERQQNQSFIYEGLKKAQKEETQEYFATEICSGNIVEQMIEQYNLECKLCKDFIKEYEALKPYILSSENSKTPFIKLKICDSEFKNINELLQAIRYKYWYKFLHKEELLSKFTSSLRKKYSNMVDEMQDYDFNEFNIMSVFERMNAEMMLGVESSIYKIFEKLSVEHSYYPECKANIHYFNGWKTNKAHKVGMKVIIPTHGMFSSSSWYEGVLDLNNAHEALSDIEKVLNYLNGKMTEEVSLYQTLKGHSLNGITKNIPCKYFSVTFYKKGTTHITFHKEFEYLIDAFNIFVCKGKNWLPPSYQKAKYEDMEKEDQQVIDEFQGKEKYEEVMKNPHLYEKTVNKMNLLSVAS